MEIRLTLLAARNSDVQTESAIAPGEDGVGAWVEGAVQAGDAGWAVAGRSLADPEVAAVGLDGLVFDGRVGWICKGRGRGEWVWVVCDSGREEGEESGDGRGSLHGDDDIKLEELCG